MHRDTRASGSDVLASTRSSGWSGAGTLAVTITGETPVELYRTVVLLTRGIAE